MTPEFNAFLIVVETIFFLLVAGYILRKTKVITDSSSKGLSKLIINIAQPMLIISSLISAERSVENIKSGFKMLAIGIGVHLFMAFCAYFACIKIKNVDERKITEFSMVFGNCGFLGFPIFNALFPKNGMFLGAFFIISFHLVLWTWGMAILARKRDDIKLNIKKVLFNLGTIPCAIGIALYFALFFIQSKYPSIDLPVFVYKGCDYIASMCVPISMLITGALIATKPLVKLFTSPKLYYLSALKLFVLPILVCVIMKLIGFDGDTVLFCTVAACMPSASTVSMLGELHNISPSFASQGVGFTTLLSIASMPCMLIIAPKLIELLG